MENGIVFNLQAYTKRTILFFFQFFFPTSKQYKHIMAVLIIMIAGIFNGI